jgi:hypothetical protein
MNEEKNIIKSYTDVLNLVNNDQSSSQIKSHTQLISSTPDLQQPPASKSTIGIHDTNRKMESKLESNDIINTKQYNKNSQSILLFWMKLNKEWDIIYKLLIIGSEEGLKLVNSYLSPELAEQLEIEASYREINKQNIKPYKNHIELYISPKMKRDNIPTMKALYDGQLPIKNLSVSCYRAYHPKDAIISNIDFGEFIVKYTDFGFQGSFGYSEKHKPLLNIVLSVKQPLANKLLENKTVNFRSPDGKTSSRKVWMPSKTNAIDLFLLNILGEYNLLIHTGYIEVIPEDDPAIEKGSSFTELSDIKSSIEIIVKQYNYKVCNYCDHNELQTKLSSCSKCKKIYYCSKLCQKANWANHKTICLF